jgi:hypothetical protein
VRAARAPHDANLGSDSRNNGYRVSFSFIDQFLDNTLGLAVGYARLSSPVVGKELGLYDPWHLNGGEHATVPADVYVTDGIKSLASSAAAGGSHFDTSHPLYRAVAELARLRGAYPAPSAWARSSSRSKSASVPNVGSTAQ